MTFARTLQVAIETEDAARAAKQTLCGTKTVNILQKRKAASASKQEGASTTKSEEKPTTKDKCYRCGKDHMGTNCIHTQITRRFCN